MVALPVWHVEPAKSVEFVVGLDAFCGDCCADFVTE
jgi:hypothetical protein